MAATDQTVKLKIDPNPKQAEFFMARERYVAYGGARAGGKSWAVRMKCVLLALNYTGIQILLLRRTFQELKENHVIPLQKTLNGIAVYKSTDNVFLFPGGSRIKMGYCDREADVLQYQGQSYDVIAMEEATHFTEFQFKALMESNRYSGMMHETFRPRMYFSCNPGGVGHAWVKRLFIDKKYEKEEDPANYTFIKSTIYDNYVMMENNPGYVKDLETLPDARRRAMLYGDWDVLEGQYFPEFRRDTHVCKPFPIPKHWRIYRAFDYGLDMLAAIWAAIDEEENAYVFRDVNEPNLTISVAAKKIQSTSAEEAYITLAPPDLWARSQESGRSKADMFRAAGLPIVKTSNNREAGWMAVREMLQLRGEGKPRLQIFENCTTLIEHLPQLLYDQHRPSDASKEPHEITHAPDALRYFAVYWLVPAERPPMEDPFAPEEDEVEAFIKYGR